MAGTGTPDFLVIGAAKAGTTSLFHALRSQTGIYLPDRQEPSFLAFGEGGPDWTAPDGTPAPIARTAVRDPDAYHALFGRAPARCVVGEVSPIYLYVPETIDRIPTHAPDARLVVILRSPAERAWSSYLHLRREGREPLDFDAAIAAEPGRIEDGVGLLWRYVDAGRYAHQLERYVEAFGRDRLLVLLHDELLADPTGQLQRILRFVGVDAQVRPWPDVRHNAGGEPRSRLLHRVVNPQRIGTYVPAVVRDRVRPLRVRLTSRNLHRPQPPGRAINALMRQFEPDLRQTEAMLGMALPTTWFT